MVWNTKLFILFVAGAIAVGAEAQSGWKAAPTPLSTRWAKDVNPNKVWPEYPRPQMKRKEWKNLNGLWEYTVNSGTKPSRFDGQILVPFAIESSLSGVGKRVKPTDSIWYRTTVDVPSKWRTGDLLLHFGAVDWECNVFVNGKFVGDHKGGYDPFSFNIAPFLGEGKQEIVVQAKDATPQFGQARGKQIQNPHGIYYTPVTGIWQTVWLEPVPKTAITRVALLPNAAKGSIQSTVTASQPANEVKVTVSFKGSEIASITAPYGGSQTIVLPDKKLWTPDSPHLYDMKVELINDGRVVDRVDSYFALRDVRVGTDKEGINRLYLNDEVIFMAGPLDQGYWPDGLYTPPTFKAMKYDLDVTKRLGFNTVRKHVKIEPAVWYRLCDEMGLMVWQDMPSAYHPEKGPEPAEAAQFELEWKRIMDSLYSYPCIVVWVPFNEGWGQYDTVRVTNWTKQYDPSRIVDSASGWHDHGAGDLNDIHAYPGPDSPKLEAKRAAALGEFGGLGFPIEGHLWTSKGNWGYISYQSKKELTDAAIELLSMTHLLTGERGLTSAIYTQTTDVEIEVNGLLTYDRELFKFDEPRLRAAIKALYKPAPVIKTLVPTAINGGQQWTYTTSAPTGNWFAPDYNRQGWKTGESGFGTKETPNTYVRTEWNSSDIWIARTFEVNLAGVRQPHFYIYHDEDAEVYVNGKLARKFVGYNGAYRMYSIPSGLLKSGQNHIAVHVKQTRGGQYIDVGIVDLVPR